jgi:xylulokinase
MINHAPKMQWWRDEHPALYGRIARFVMPAVYVAGRLAGLGADDAFTDPTYLHFTGVADARLGDWSTPLLAALELDAPKLPRIVASDEVIGRLTVEAADACGLRPGIPLAAGMGDTAAGALGAGLIREGELLDTAGTAAVLTGCVPTFPAAPDGGLIVMRGGLRGQWMALNYVAGGGLCLPWLAAQLGATAGDPNAIGDTSLAALLAEASAVAPGSDGVLFVPHLEGRTAPYEPSMRGGFAGLGLGHTRAHLARAVLEGIGFEYMLYAESMRRTHPASPPDSVRSIGGGARSPLWNQIKADMLGIPVRRVEVDETATRGAALLAASAVGAIDVDAVATDVPMSAPFAPDPESHAFYADRLALYRRLADAHAALAAAPTSTDSPTPERSLLA